MSGTIEVEADRIIKEATVRGILLRLLGGLAVRHHSPSASYKALARGYPDLDFFGTGKQGGQIKLLFVDLGYLPNQRFNALHGETRLIFNHPSHGWHVDIFLDVFRMCHTLRIGKRLMLDEYTIPLSDLLLTKLQIVELNDKDIRDTLALLLDHEIRASTNPSTDSIDSEYIAGLCGSDWGLYKTITTNLRKISQLVTNYELNAEERQAVEGRAGTLLREIETAPKSLKWRLRDRVGEKVKWYDLPEVP